MGYKKKKKKVKTTYRPKKENEIKLSSYIIKENI
tara:strand:- start:1746 stop:1847 length:102 start_codon:yes stop_codon:yes gene_type:complete